MTKTNIITESLMAIIDNEASTDQGPTLKATEAQTIETQNLKLFSQTQRKNKLKTSKTSKLIINFERPEYDPLFSPHKLISTTAHETVTVLWVKY